MQKWEFGWTPQARTVLLHELQHAVQRIEGFSGGSSIRYWNNRLERGYDGRTASQRQKLNDLRAEYNKAKTEDPAFVADMMKLEAMTPNVPRGKVDFDTLTQIEPDPIEWQQYDAAREKLEGQYGDMKVWNFIDLIQDLQKAEAAPGRTASELYRDTAGEIEARDVEARANLTAEERKAKAPDTGNQDTVFADSRDAYSIGQTTDDRSFVAVDKDILAGVPRAQWVATVKENLREKFPNGITVGNNEISIDKQSRREMTFSRYMQWLYKNDQQIYADKLRATDNADEILRTATGWVSEGLNHQRKDNIKDFARGDILLRIGKNSYTADVVVGTRENGSMLLYDVLNLQPTSFTEKKTDAAITVNPLPGVGRNTASVSDNSIPGKVENVNGKIPLKSDSQGRALTQAQQEFFRDSKVVDRDGNLMVMYHGTKAENGDFTVFDYSKAVKKGGLGLKAMGKGNYFTSKQLNGTERFGSRVIEAYLNITNPFVYNGMNGDTVSLAEQVSKATGADTQGMNYDQLQNKMRELGYDGVIEYRRDGSMGVAVTFDSNQIKSVTNQSPTSDPDIRFSQDLTELEDLRKENKRLREQVDHWKGQLQKTTPENRTVRQKDVDRLAKDLVKSYESTLDTAQVSAELKKLGEFIVRNGDGKNELTWEAVHDSALKIGRELQFSYPNDTFPGNVRRNPAFFSPISTDFLLFFPFICIIIESRYIQILSLFGSRHI